MAAEGFNYKEFADDLSQQAKAVLPSDLSQEEKDFVFKTVHNFCFIAGEAISNDTKSTFTVDQASIITQFIGEWSYHKSIDVIRGKVPVQFRDGILQKVAFTVFEIAKQATLKNVSQDEMIRVVEHHVKKVFNESVAELMKKGALTQKQAQNAVNQSNIDVMAQADNEAIAGASDLKILKMAAFALLMQKLPKDKVRTLLSNFNQSDAQVLLQYMQMDDLETKIDPVLLKQCLEDFHSIMPQDTTMSISKTVKLFGRNIRSVPEEVIVSIIARERPGVAELFSNPQSYEKMKLSASVMQVINNHLEEKIHDYKTRKV